MAECKAKPPDAAPAELGRCLDICLRPFRHVCKGQEHAVAIFEGQACFSWAQVGFTRVPLVSQLPRHLGSPFLFVLYAGESCRSLSGVLALALTCCHFAWTQKSSEMIPTLIAETQVAHFNNCLVVERCNGRWFQIRCWVSQSVRFSWILSLQVSGTLSACSHLQMTSSRSWLLILFRFLL